jgi:hypothetical protein
MMKKAENNDKIQALFIVLCSLLTVHYPLLTDFWRLTQRR